jgi:branched-chain amino acid transport system permease protein
MGINVRRFIAFAWALTGLVAAIGGIVWGHMIGVDVYLSIMGLKVFPVVILGGLTSIPGTIIAGLMVGAVESVSAGYIDPYVGGGLKDFVPFVLIIIVLFIRPHGLFGEETIESL